MGSALRVSSFFPQLGASRYRICCSWWFSLIVLGRRCWQQKRLLERRALGIFCWFQHFLYVYTSLCAIPQYLGDRKTLGVTHLATPRSKLHAGPVHHSFSLIYPRSSNKFISNFTFIPPLLCSCCSCSRSKIRRDLRLETFDRR